MIEDSLQHSAGKSPKFGSPEPIAALNRVKILEKGAIYEEKEPLVDIRMFCPKVAIVKERVCPFLRVRAATMLNAAQERLPEGYQLRVSTALRTLTMQKRGWDAYFQRMKDEHPEWKLPTLRRATNKYYAPYDQPAPPGHTTGGAIDVAVLDPEGKTLDMIAPTTGWEAAYTWSDKISAEAKANRMMMVEAMLGAGFSNCRDEYWHYSWGDSAWAVRVGQTECPYGFIYPPACMETDIPHGTGILYSMKTQRDSGGKPTGADGMVEAIPSLEQDAVFYVGIFWANAVPTRVRVALPSPNDNPKVFLSSDSENWQPVEQVTKNLDSLTITITPDSDRVYLTTNPPPSEPKPNS